MNCTKSFGAALFAIALSLLPFSAIANEPDAPIDFKRDILPILSDSCFHCHGPDEGARQADLRLDTRQGLFHALGDQAIVKPGHPEQSQLYMRLTSDSPDERMPPADSGRTVSPDKIERIKQWIAAGAPWEKHWSFQPLARPAVPKTQRTDWGNNPIDAFVLAALEQQGLSPSQEADPATLSRRISLDLTGLPRHTHAAHGQAQREQPLVYEQLVEQLLASPRYAERMATEWLDTARFADTHGYQMDRFRQMSAYRDWVLQAFSRDLSYRDFVTWQIAGDLLPNATQEQRLATAFNRLHMQNEEGGIVEEEFRVAYVVDRVNTFGTAFLGLTFECSRCHDHKYDPISMRDFYGLFSMFQNIDESGQTSYFTAAMPVPTVLLTSSSEDTLLQELENEIALLESQQPQQATAALAAFDAWLESKPADVPADDAVARFAFDDAANNQYANSANPGQPGNAVDGPVLVPGHNGQAIQSTAENGATFPGVGHFKRVDPFSISFWILPAEVSPRQVVLHHSRAPIDAGSRGYEVLLENGQVSFGMHHMWPGNSLKVAAGQALPVGAWTHVAVTYDGSSRASGVRLYIHGESSPLTIIRDGLQKDITYGGEPDLAFGYRFRDNGFKGGSLDELVIHARELAPLEVAALAGKDALQSAWATPHTQLTQEQLQALRQLYLARFSPEYAQWRQSLFEARSRLNAAKEPIPEAMVMQEMRQPKPAFVLKRGQYDAPSTPVEASVPAALPPLPESAPANRLGLAQWLFLPEHPLAARVAANRLWQIMFGRGIVETSENFGSQGSPPTHPELLDYLACELQDSGWDQRHVLRLIAESATYRQNSAASPELIAADPANIWLARGPRKRLSAEMLRDQALQVSGLLVEKLGGPSVKPYQPAGVWDVAMGGPVYDQSHGPDLYRRSLYTYWKRTVPHPAMIVFDSAERNNCSVRRQTTTTPMQALALLNDPQMVECARKFAERAMKEGGATPAEQLQFAFYQALGREATPGESAILLQLLQEQAAIFSSDATVAERLLTVGEFPADAGLDKVELAAMTVCAQALLNHDAVIMCR